MRVLLLSWEYPPNVMGGLGKHVAELVPALADLGVEVHVLTPLFEGKGGDQPGEEQHGNLHVHRVTVPRQSYDSFYEHALHVNHLLEAAASQLLERFDGFDILHNHDWLTSFCARRLKAEYHVPLVTTIHATERGRGRGSLPNLQAERINEAEWRLTYEAWRVICCTQYMRQELESFFETPADKIDVIPNGVDPAPFERWEGVDLSGFRSRYALPGEQIIFFVGRMVREKGAHILLEAVPRVLEECPEAKFVLAGKGPELDNLRNMADAMHLGEKVLLAGFVSDDDRDRLFKVCDCAVFPSLYEPFGIVALEAMTAEAPVVVSEVGGLKEVVQHAETGITVYPGDPASCAWGIVHTLKRPDWAHRRVQNALERVRTVYNWHVIAEQTLAVYQLVSEERAATDW